MKLMLTVFLMLVTLLPAGAVTMRSEKINGPGSMIVRDRQVAQTRLLVAGYLYTGPALKKTSAGTAGDGATTLAPKGAPQAMVRSTSIPQPGNSGARAQ